MDNLEPSMRSLSGPFPAVDSYVAKFEAEAFDHAADVRDFLPEEEHPAYRVIVVELLRSAMELYWTRPERITARDAMRQFPWLCSEPEMLEALQFEERRLRESDSRGVDGGEPLELLSRWYAADPSVSHADVKSFVTDHTQAAHSLAGAVSRFPQAGERIGPYELVRELGRGAFGRVYLARQRDLADRLVAVKVSCLPSREPEFLARLQHTNIVPIHAAGRFDSLHVHCMPFLGGRTLADVLRERKAHETSGNRLASEQETAPLGVDVTRLETDERTDRPRKHEELRLQTPAADVAAPHSRAGTPRGYPDRIAWLGSELAAGLAYAHAKGITHGDVKPANILIADDDRPMLLDFSLASDELVAETASLRGGTLPYMSPEQLCSLRGEAAIDARSDVYSLGVVLWESMTGRLPFPTRPGPIELTLPIMIEDRRAEPPRARDWNRDVSPDLDRILRRCLHPDPRRRYQNGDELREDLCRHLNDERPKYARGWSPIESQRKWCRRHPRLSSSATVATAMFIFLAAIALAWSASAQRARRELLIANADRFHHDYAGFMAVLSAPDSSRSQIEKTLRQAELAIESLGVVSRGEMPDPREQLSTTLPPAIWDQTRRELLDLFFCGADACMRMAKSAGDGNADAHWVARAKTWNDGAAAWGGGNTRAVLLQAASIAEMSARPESAHEYRRRAAKVPSDIRQAVVDSAHALANGRLDLAIQPLEKACGEMPSDFVPRYLLGLAYLQQERPHEARECFEICLILEPDSVWARFQRGVCYQLAEQFTLAARDFDFCLEQQPDHVSAWVNRALVRQELGDLEAAIADLSSALAYPECPTRALLLRSRLYRRLGKIEAAGVDMRFALEQIPADEKSWVARGLARLPGDPQGALSDFDNAIARFPPSRLGLRNKAHVLADYLHQTESSIAALSELLEVFPEDHAAWCGRAVLHARLGNRDQALADAGRALALSDTPLNVYQAAGAFALTSKLDSSDKVQAIRMLGWAFRADPSLRSLASEDPDLVAITNEPEFQELMRQAATWERENQLFSQRVDERATLAANRE